MQYVVCKINQCPFRSENGFCLHRCVVINENGQCARLISGECGGPVQDKYKATSDNWAQKKEEKIIDDEELLIEEKEDAAGEESDTPVPPRNVE